MQKLKHRLLDDLDLIGLDVDFDLILRPYSKSFFGNYNPNNNTIVLYVYEDMKCTRLYSYKSLLLTLIHEAVHCLQWGDPTFNRVKGVMHNMEFKKLYAHYSDKAQSKLLLREVVSSEKSDSQRAKIFQYC